MITFTARKLKPTATVTHTGAAFLYDWMFGASVNLAAASDYMAADSNVGPLRQSFFCKLFYELCENSAFEFLTARCNPNLSDHTTTKSRELLEAHTYASLANGGAFVFTDAIDPVGTLNRKICTEMGKS